MKEEQRNPSRDVQYVFDGSGLLHRVPWPRGSTCESVSHLYVRDVAQKYGAAAIVFDGYTDHPTSKDATHLRRPGDCVGVPVHFASGVMIKSKMDEFLNNKAYRQQFIRGTTKVGEITKKVQERRLKWYGHVMRREEHYVGRRAMVMKVQGRRKRGRPKRRWLDKVKDDIKEKGLSADDVYDRATWRRMSSYIDPT